MDEERREALLDEAFGLHGMIREVMAKATLLKNRAARYDLSLKEEDVEGKVAQMHRDLATYSDRLDEIYEEMSDYGTISPISGMGGEPNLN